MLEAVREKLFEHFGRTSRLLFYAGMAQKECPQLRLTIICHGTRRCRRIHSELKTNKELVESTDMRITHILDQELEQNHEKGALVALGGEYLVDFVDDNHLCRRKWVSTGLSTRCYNSQVPH